MSTSVDRLPKVFRLKRKVNEDPLSTLALSIKRSRKSSPDDHIVIQDFLHLAKSCCQPVDPDLSSNVDYHDLSIVKDAGSLPCTKTELNKHTDSDNEHVIKDDAIHDLLKIDPDHGAEISSNGSTDHSDAITCNGQVMCRVKGPLSSLKKTPTEFGEEFVYDFYVPKSYDLFKAGLPDKISCKIDTDNLIDGVISLNASQDQDCLEFNSDCETGDWKNYAQRVYSKLGKSRCAGATNRFAEFNPDDEDSNDEDDWRNDYPDEDDADAQNFDSAYDCGVEMDFVVTSECGGTKTCTSTSTKFPRPKYYDSSISVGGDSGKEDDNDFDDEDLRPYLEERSSKVDDDDFYMESAE